MTSFLGGLLDLLVAHPYLLLVPIGLGWAMLRYNGRVRRRLKARGWSRRGRRLLAGVMSVIGAAIVLSAFGFLVPVAIMLISGI
jgi:hypothetical protein